MNNYSNSACVNEMSSMGSATNLSQSQTPEIKNLLDRLTYQSERAAIVKNRIAESLHLLIPINELPSTSDKVMKEGPTYVAGAIGELNGRVSELALQLSDLEALAEILRRII